MKRRRSLPALLLPLAIACGERPAPPDAAPIVPGPVRVLRVNPGQHGMAAIVRWLRSPDGRALLVVEDWSSTENDPYYDGFMVASEAAGRTVRVDSVWDAVPSPDWRRVAFGKGSMLVAGESERLPEDSLAAVAGRLGVPVEEARAAQFPASGMVAAAGFSRLGVVEVVSGAERIFPVLAGWRVRWSADGSRIFAGRGPAMSDDDAPASGWLTVDAANGSVVGTSDSASAEPAWTIGPTIDVSVTPDTGRVEIPLEGVTIVSAGGTIRLGEREIGPGYALAATARGCYIAALARDADAGEYDAKYRLVVYDTGCPAPGSGR